MITAMQQDLERGLAIPGYVNLEPLVNNTLSLNSNIRRSALLAPERYPPPFGGRLEP